MTIESTYLEVCAKRPEAAVRGELAISFDPNRWKSDDIVYQDDFDHEMTTMLPEYVAEALIVSQWLTLLPPDAILWRGLRIRDGKEIEGEYVWRIGNRRSVYVSEGDTPLHVLAEHLLGRVK